MLSTPDRSSSLCSSFPCLGLGATPTPSSQILAVHVCTCWTRPRTLCRDYTWRSHWAWVRDRRACHWTRHNHKASPSSSTPSLCCHCTVCTLNWINLHQSITDNITNSTWRRWSYGYGWLCYLKVRCSLSSFYFLKMLRHSFDLINISQIIHLGSGSQLSHDYGRGRGLSTVFRIGLASITSERLWLLAYDYGWLQQKTFSSKSQVININSINLFLLIAYHFQISLSSPTANSRLHRLINFGGPADKPAPITTNTR